MNGSKSVPLMVQTTPVRSNYDSYVTSRDQLASEQTPWGKAVSKKAQEGQSWLTWVFAMEDGSEAEEKLGSSVTEGHRKRPVGSNLMLKQIGANEITSSLELPISIQWPTTDHQSQGGNAFAAIGNFTIADEDNLSYFGFKTEILGGLKGADVEFVDPSANDGGHESTAEQLMLLSSLVKLD